MAGQASRYRVLLPKTKFPLRTNAITQEPAIQRAAKFDELYKWQLETRKNSNKTFTLHDGPPYANGEPHMGHVLNKVLKDFVNRYKLMRGYRVLYRPGWDCHGLPIELKACQDLDRNELSPLKIRSKAAQFARKAMGIQKEAFKRWGCLGDWENPYITMDREYEADQIKVFHEMYKRGCIYRGFKPVYWSPSTSTALAEAELEYKEHTSQAVYVLFPLCNFSTKFNISGHTHSPVYAAMWTTTPWTLLANRAICFHPDHTYSLIRTRGQQLILLGQSCLPTLSSSLGEFEMVSDIPGRDLEGMEYRNPLDTTGRARPFLPGSHVTGTEGTGLVHTAPAHGFEDYHIGVQNQLDLTCHVDDHGRYTSELGVDYEGLFVLDEGNRAVLERLSSLNVLLHKHSYRHRYPYDWRAKKLVIIRSTEQWFASVKQLKDEARAALKDVRMYPESAMNRLVPMLGSRDDWCISRQRVWGVPLPIFYHEVTNEALLTHETITHVERLFRERGTDSWWRLPTSELLPPSMESQADSFTRGSDTMDVWFDSGSSWAGVLKESGGVADMYLEGSDQHRGWFQSSLLTSVAAQGKAPYKSVVTHGFVLDATGSKMSKSLGNVISPEEILHTKQFGADVIRLWVASTNYSNISGVNLSDEILQQNSNFLQRLRNCLRFILSNLSDFNPNCDLLPYSELTKLDRYLLHILFNYSSLATDSFESLNFSQLYHHLTQLVPLDLSAFYFDIIKDSLYCDALGSLRRRSVQTSLHHLLSCLVRTLAPILPHLTEEVTQHYHFDQGSVFRCEWPKCPSQWVQSDLAAEFEVIRSVRAVCNKALDLARSGRTIKSSLEANLTISTDSPHLLSLLASHKESSHGNEFPLQDILIVSRLSLSCDSTPDTFALTNQSSSQSTNQNRLYVCSEQVSCEGDEHRVQVVAKSADSASHKCPRCWKYTSSVENSLCERCSVVITDL